MRKEVLDLIEAHLKNNSDAMFITADLGYGAIEKIRDKYPKQFINSGISEANTILIATGLALNGHEVIVYSIGNFITLRILEFLRNGPLYHELKIIIIAIGAGFSYGQLGFTHHLTEDISVMRALPNINVFSCADPYEAKIATTLALASKNTSYIRLSKNSNSIHSIDENDKLDIIRVYEGDDIQLITTGEILSEVIESRNKMNSLGYDVGVISIIKLKPLNGHLLKKLIKSKNLVTIEEHNLDGGFGSLILEEVSNWSEKYNITRIGLKNTFSKVVGDSNYLREINSLTSRHIVEMCLELLK